MPVVVGDSVSGHESVLKVLTTGIDTVKTGIVAIADPTVAASGLYGPPPEITVASQAGSGVMKVSDAVIEALLAVTVTSKPSVTVIKTVG